MFVLALRLSPFPFPSSTAFFLFSSFWVFNFQHREEKREGVREKRERERNLDYFLSARVTVFEILCVLDFFLSSN